MSQPTFTQGSNDDPILLNLSADGVLEITLNRPEKLNALSREMHYKLSQIWLDAQRDPDVRVILITGAGRAFCAGGDLSEQRVPGDRERIMRVQKIARDIVLNMINCDKPIISAINGPAAGAGTALALLADISFIAPEAKIVDGHIRIGVSAGDHAALWPLFCSLAKVKYYLLTGEAIPGAEAERIGLVSKCVPLSELHDAATTTAVQLARGPASAIVHTKRALNHWFRAAQPVFEHSLALEMLDMFGADAAEGANSFVENRDPGFTAQLRSGSALSEQDQ
jgi:enoyl-CoA hydratase